MNSRFVLIALGRPRSVWLDHIVSIATSGAIPAEVHKAVGIVDLFTQMTGGRAASAVLLDAGAPGVDRDVITRVHACGVSVFVVTDPLVPRDWSDLGADAVFTQTFRADELLDALTRSARSIPTTSFPDVASDRPFIQPPPWDASLIAVIGSGGTGASTVAIAAAQGLAQSDRGTTGVALIDLCRNAEQSMLHDADPSAPGLLELIDACRLGSPDAGAVQDHLTSIYKRGYDLLPGLRRRRLWTQLRPASSSAALAALRRCYGVVIADLDADLEGEAEAGSIDLEERHQLTRLAIDQATVTLVVGHASMKGLHSLTRVLRDLVDHGAAPSTLQPLFNFAPTGARSRSGYTAALAELTDGLGLSSTPIFVPTKDIDDRLRALVPFPSAVVEPIAGALKARLALRQAASTAVPSPVPMRTGFLRRGAAAR